MNKKVEMTLKRTRTYKQKKECVTGKENGRETHNEEDYRKENEV